jgi:hypothetical protein
LACDHRHEPSASAYAHETEPNNNHENTPR